MNLSQIKSRYSGIQTKMKYIGEYGCLFLCLCTIVEEVTGCPCDIAGLIQECTTRGWLSLDYDVHDSVAILNCATGKSFKRVILSKLPSII